MIASMNPPKRSDTGSDRHAVLALLDTLDMQPALAGTVQLQDGEGAFARNERNRTAIK